MTDTKTVTTTGTPHRSKRRAHQDHPYRLPDLHGNPPQQVAYHSQKRLHRSNLTRLRSLTKLSVVPRRRLPRAAHSQCGQPNAPRAQLTLGKNEGGPTAGYASSFC